MRVNSISCYVHSVEWNGIFLHAQVIYTVKHVLILAFPSLESTIKRSFLHSSSLTNPVAVIKSSFSPRSKILRVYNVCMVIDALIGLLTHAFNIRLGESYKHVSENQN